MADVNMLSGLRIVVVGLGQEGRALVDYLIGHGLTVTATDIQTAEQLGAAAADLERAGVSLVLGEHPATLLDETDLLFVSPGVPLEIPFLQQARARKLPLSTESRLFCHLCPAQIVAITGSSGKTTTTTLVSKILEADGKKTWLGGNIGRPLISVVDQIQPDDKVVMELSSFQLEYFHASLNQGVNLKALPSADPQQLAQLLASWSPPIAAMLNITPNHLDRHPSMKHYVKAKRAIIDYQQGDRVLIMNLDNDMTRTIGSQFGSHVRWFSTEAHMPGGAGLVKDTLVLFDWDNKPQTLTSKSQIKLRGLHNLSNILAACLISREAGASVAAMREVITSFAGVEHRLEFVRELNGASYFNDSISTSPERLIAALQSFKEPIVLLAGGRDKHLPWEEAARLILHKARTLILFGEAAGLIADAIERAKRDIPAATVTLHRCANLAQAVQQAGQIAKPGDVVLLSPGCASYDAFRNYMERGRTFKELVRQLGE